MAYIIPILLIILGLLFPKNKLVSLFFVVYFWVLMGLNIKTPDYDTYERLFDNVLTLYGENYEIGYTALCALGNYLGLSFQQFRMCIGAIVALLSYLSAKRLSPFPNYILALFLFWPFVPGVSGMRQTLANIIVACGFPCLYEKNKKGVIKYILWVVCAWSIHRSALFFIVFVLCMREFGNKEKKLLLYAIGAGIVVIGFSSILNNLDFITSNHKLDKWLNLNADQGADHQNLAGFLIRAFIVLSYAYVIPRLYRVINRYTDLSDNDKYIIRLCSNTSLIITLIIPGFFVTGEYQRILYGTMIIFSVVMSYGCYIKTPVFNKKKSVYMTVSYALFLITAWYYTFSMTSHDVIATLSDNLLFK